jgi:hypothetical protein
LRTNSIREMGRMGHGKPDRTTLLLCDLHVSALETT